MNRIPKQLAISLLLAVLSLTGAQAASPPEGIDAGKWVLSPYWESSLEYDDNISKRPDLDSVSDFIHRVVLGMQASVPIKNSLLELDYHADQRKYQDHPFPSDLAQQARARLQLNSSTGDRFVIQDSYTLGVADVQTIDAGGELTFQGEPFNFNVAEVEVSRESRQMQGYSIQVKHIDLEFESRTMAFFNYRGFESAFEYRQPLARNNWLIAYHSSRRINHYDPLRDNLYYRSEASATYQIGMRGQIGGRHAFHVRTGFGHFEYKGPEAAGSDFNGLVARANFQFVLGSRTILAVSIDRRPLPSFYRTYYINNVLRVKIEREWPLGSKAGLSAAVGKNTYGDPLVGFCRQNTPLERVDKRLMVDAHYDLKFHSLVGLRLSASHWRRDSSCELMDYNANVISAGIVLGWSNE